MAHPQVTLNDGNQISLIGLGTYSDPHSGGREITEAAVYESIKCGYRHIDTAYCYEVEKEVGNGVKKAIAEGIVKREDIKVVTKIWMTNMKRDKLFEQAEKSNKELDLGYIDVLLLHWPTAIRSARAGEEAGPTPNPFIPLDKNGKPFPEDVDINKETWTALEEVREKGIARSIGVSNYNTQQIKDLVAVCTVKPVMNQVECTPFLPQIKLNALCREHDIYLEAYCPIGGGPRYNGGKLVETDLASELRDHPVIKDLAQKYNKTPQQIMLKFQIDREIIVLAKSVTPSRIVQNQDILDFTLTKEEISSLEKLGCGKRNVALDFMKDHPEFPFGQE